MSDTQVVKPSVTEAISKIVSTVKGRSSAVLKVSRSISKTLAENEEYNVFMSMSADDFQKKVPAKFRTLDNVNKTLENILGSDKSGLVLDAEAQAQKFSVLTEELVESDVARKRIWLSSFKQDEQEQARAANQLSLYKASLMLAVRNSKPYKKYLYRIED
jgi:hypothetical protein